MKAKIKTSEASSLEDFFPVKSFDSAGFFEDEDGSHGFVLEIHGLDGSFLATEDFEGLQQKWRGFLSLKRSEEIQIVFRKQSDFEEVLNEKLEAVGATQSEVRKKLLWSLIEHDLNAIERQGMVYETSIHLAYRSYEKPSVEMENESLSSRLSTLLFQLEEMGLRGRMLNSVEIGQAVAKSCHGLGYFSVKDTLDDWPQVSILPQGVQIGGEAFRAVTLKGLPESFSELGMIQALTLIRYPLELCVRFRGKDIEPVKKKYERRKQILFGMATRKASGDPQSEAQFRETDEVLRRLAEQNDSLCEMTLTIGIRGKDSVFLRQALTAILNARSGLKHAELEESSLNIFDCFLEGRLLFRGQVHHQQTVLSSNGVHFLPFFSPSQGDAGRVVSFRTRYGSLYHLDPISTKLSNFNWLVSGASGSGKSFFVNSLLLQSLSLNPRVFIVDIGGSYNKLTEFLGGKLLALDVESRFKLGPFYMEKGLSEKEERRRRENIQTVFAEMCRDEGSLPSIEERAILYECLTPLFDMNVLPEHPIAHVRDELLKLKMEKARRLALLLGRWAYPSFFGGFLDHGNPLQIDSDVITWDLKSIGDYEDLSRVVQLILCSAVWNSLRERKRFTYIVLDEVAFSLLRWQPQFVAELVATVRKHFASVVCICQSLETITGNQVAGHFLLNNSARKAILQQRGEARGYETPLGLTSVESQVIRSLGRKKGSYSEIFLMDEERRAVLRFEPDPLTYLLSTSDSRDNEKLTIGLDRCEGTFAEKVFQFLEKGESL